MDLTKTNSLIGLVGVALLCSGCVTFYQPQVSLQRPVVVDPDAANFEGVRMLIRCEAGELVKGRTADTLCGNVRSLFTNQGATVEIDVPSGRNRAIDDEHGTPDADLIVDLTSRRIHQHTDVFSYILSIASLTLLPGISDSTFAQDIQIKDKTGFLLASDTLQGRFEQYFGFGVWALENLLDLIVRPAEEKVAGNAAKEDFSKDFYGQLSQLAFQAHMRTVVMGTFEPGPSK